MVDLIMNETNCMNLIKDLWKIKYGNVYGSKECNLLMELMFCFCCLIKIVIKTDLIME